MIAVSSALYAITITAAVIQILLFRRALSTGQFSAPVGASVCMLIIVVLTLMMFLGLSAWHLLWAIPVCFITGSVLIIWPPYKDYLRMYLEEQKLVALSET